MRPDSSKTMALYKSCTYLLALSCVLQSTDYRPQLAQLTVMANFQTHM